MEKRFYKFHKPASRPCCVPGEAGGVGDKATGPWGVTNAVAIRDVHGWAAGPLNVENAF